MFIFPGIRLFSLIPSDANCIERLFTRLVVPERITLDRIKMSIGSFTAAEVIVIIEPPPLYDA